MMLKVYSTVFWMSYVYFLAANAEKFRICVVDGRGGFKRAAKFCPILDSTDSKAECVIGVDRLDCLRRISKGKVDFSVFTPEDLVTATNSEVEVLLTNEMRFTKEKYEYEVVAVISNEAGIESKHDLRDKKFCHPGYGYETDWTSILANFLEASVVPQMCETSLTLTENRIASSSKFFKAACKAGPWVNDPVDDAVLKTKYPNLCELCDVPGRCSRSDKYWGRRGPLYCLTDGFGDISWARLDDVKMHFGLTPGSTVVSPQGYSYLCQDGSVIPVNGTAKPCVWVVKPWPVIASRKKRAPEIQQFMSQINQQTPNKWESALLSLLMTFKKDIMPLDPIEPIESYLMNAQGFLSANSFTGCHPPRTVRVCTTSNIANAKCGWLREAAAVYGVEPDVDCLKADNITHCMDAIQYNAADIVITPPDHINIGMKKYNLRPLFYETVDDDNKYITVAVVKRDSHYQTIGDLKGAKACFPTYDGIAWNSVIHALKSNSLLTSCPSIAAMADYFGPSCVPNVPSNSSHALKLLCQDDMYDGEYGAIRCLDQTGDVAFMSKNQLERFFKDPRESIAHLRRADFRILEENTSKPYHLSWAPIGQAMVSQNRSEIFIRDALNVFLQLDALFGKSFKSVTTPYSLFGVFDGKANVLFHDATVRLKSVPYSKINDKMENEYNGLLESMTSSPCVMSSGVAVLSTCLTVILSALSLYV